MKPPFRSPLENLKPYPPGKPIEEVQREFGLSRVVKLASNENPFGPSPLALEAIRTELPTLHLYPESHAHYLRKKLSDRLDIEPESLIFGNGSDEIVALMTLSFLEPGANIVCSEHTFARYEMGAASMGARTRHVPMIDWRHDPRGLAAAVDADTRFLFIANPENPVGSAISTSELEQLLDSVPKTVPVVIDEAYYEFAASWTGYPDSLALRKKYSNVVILRTFSKAFGLAGIRLGYGIAGPDLWDVVDRVRPPFNVNRLAQAAACAALDDVDHLRKTIEGNARGRDYLCHEFDRLGLAYVPSFTNFVLVDMKRPAMPVYEALLRKGVIVRPMGMYSLPNHLRISVGLPEENRIFVEALEEILSRQ